MAVKLDDMLWSANGAARALLRGGLAVSQVEGFLYLKSPPERGALDKELENAEDQIKQALALVIQARKQWAELVKGKKP